MLEYVGWKNTLSVSRTRFAHLGLLLNPNYYFYSYMSYSRYNKIIFFIFSLTILSVFWVFFLVRNTSFYYMSVCWFPGFFVWFLSMKWKLSYSAECITHPLTLVDILKNAIQKWENHVNFMWLTFNLIPWVKITWVLQTGSLSSELKI